MAAGADERGQRLLMDVGLDLGGHRINKQVEFQLEAAVRGASVLRLPFSWRATGPQGLFPVLEGDIEVAPLGDCLTQLAVSARYAPPLGLLGRVFDRTLLYRVAEGTIKDFVERVCHRVAPDAGTSNSAGS